MFVREGIKVKGVSLIALTKEDKILFYLRDNKPSIPFPNHWSFIGGSIEKDENSLQALKREIKEEIPNCEVKNIKFIKELDLRNIPEYKELLFMFSGEVDMDVKDIKLTEGQRLEYFSMDEIKNLKIAPALKKFIFQNKEKLMKKES